MVVPGLAREREALANTPSNVDGGGFRGKKILVKHLIPRVLTGQSNKLGGSIESHCFVSKCSKVHQVTARSTAKVENAIRPGAAHVGQERFGVLANVVVFGAFPKISGILIVVRDGMAADTAQMLA